MPTSKNLFHAMLYAIPILFPSLAFAVEPAKENVPGGALMLAAYILIWALPLGFLWLSHKRISALEGDLDELRSLLRDAQLAEASVEPHRDAEA